MELSIETWDSKASVVAGMKQGIPLRVPTKVITPASRWVRAEVGASLRSLPPGRAKM